MKTFVPGYYKDFKCIADKCKNSCCIGWEIDIDDDTLGIYKKVEGAFGERLKKCISVGDESCFILEAGERCPFLNANNLCDIYIELGEEKLCQICSDHPRFRNFFDSRIEMGLGLCCEAAADLILDWEKPFELTAIEDDGEAETSDDEEAVFFALRDKAIEIVQNKDSGIKDCIENLLETFGVDFPKKSFKEWIDIYLSLEILDPEWSGLLKSAGKCENFRTELFDTEKGQTIQRQLLVYFLYRHMADGIYDESLGARVGFAVLSLEMIKALCATSEKADFDTFKDIARRYSAEIEYNVDNTESLIEEHC